MNGDLAEIRMVLAGVGERIGSAYQQAGIARDRIADALSVLGGMTGEHSEPLVPEELSHAAEELDRGLGLISGGAAAVADVEARL